MNEVLQIESLGKAYEANSFALKDVSLQLHKGEILAIVGESGCGKTTLLRLVAGLETPTEGIIVIDGITVAADQVWVKPEKRKVGMVFQDHALFPHLTVSQNVGYGLPKTPERQTITHKTLALVGLEKLANRYPYQLSGGQQQRVALARALAPKPAILLLDEPFSNLDEMLREQLRNELQQILKEAQTTALFVTHDTKDALTIADRMVLLKKGVAQQIGTPKQVYQQPNNHYVANFFGRTNQLPNGRQIRPENIKITKVTQTQQQNGVVKHIQFFGFYQELTVAMPHTDVLVKTLTDEQFSIGEAVNLTFPTN